MVERLESRGDMAGHLITESVGTRKRRMNAGLAGIFWVEAKKNALGGRS